MKTTIRVFLIIAVACGIQAFSFCFAQQKITGLSQLTGKTIAVPKGTVADQLVWKKFPEARIIYFDNALLCIMAVKAGKVDAAAYDEPIMRMLLGDSQDMAILPEFISNDNYAFAINPARPDLKLAIDRRIAELRESGMLASMNDYWFPASGEQPHTPNVIVEVQDGKSVSLATFPNVEPFSFRDRNGRVAGYDIELAGYIAQVLHAELLIREMEFEELIPAVANGRVDMAAAFLTKTPERMKHVLFSEPYYNGGIAVVVRK